MRFLLYNIRYGTGGIPGHMPGLRYLRKTHRNLTDIIGFIRPFEPDIVGLVEVDAGSYRSNARNQAQTIAEALGHYHTYRCKYAVGGVFARIPLLRKQGNAFLTRDSITQERFHYFESGMKRLVIELELPEVNLFLVHLALTFRTRHGQLSELYSLVKDSTKPCIVAGDFNALWGEREINLFLAATGLLNPNAERRPSFPSWAPRRHLDFILHSPSITCTLFQMPSATLSDHLPLICDFDLPAGAAPAQL